MIKPEPDRDSLPAIDKRELTYLVMQLVLVVTVEEEVRLEMKTGSTTQACINRPNMGCHESQPRKKEDISSELRSRRSSDRGDDDFLVPSHDHHFIYASAPPLSLSLSPLFSSLSGSMQHHISTSKIDFLVIKSPQLFHTPSN